MVIKLIKSQLRIASMEDGCTGTCVPLTRPDNTTKCQLPKRINIFKLQGFLFSLSFKFHDSYQLLVIFSNLNEWSPSQMDHTLRHFQIPAYLVDNF